jgi:hypothetical protein
VLGSERIATRNWFPMTPDLPIIMGQRAQQILTAVSAAQRATMLLKPEAGQLRSISYRPGRRCGVTLGEMDSAARKASFQLLAEAVSPHTFAQMTTIMGYEEVLDLNAGWTKAQHSGDYYLTFFGEPTPTGTWAWRLEGHHLSITVCVSRSGISATPLFLGANPDCISYAGRTVLRPLGAEGELAIALMAAMKPAERAGAIASEVAPHDVRFLNRSPVLERCIRAAELSGDARTLLTELVMVYVDRFSGDQRAQLAEVATRPDMEFAWWGATLPGQAHIYCVSIGNDLIIEYGNNYHNQTVANHSHSYIRSPAQDFGVALESPQKTR